MRFNQFMLASITPGCQCYKCFNFMLYEMGPVLATEGKSCQTATHITSRECVEGIGVGVGVFNDGK
jgi:hypothetical protein